MIAVDGLKQWSCAWIKGLFVFKQVEDSDDRTESRALPATASAESEEMAIYACDREERQERGGPEWILAVKKMSY